MTTLRVGEITYANLFPIFHFLKKSSGSYEFIEGYPSMLNRMLREGGLDISTSSSIEYLRDAEAYIYIKGHSISSNGPAGSILFFSRSPIESLKGGNISVTHQSETSVALLDIILRKFYGIDCALSVTDAPFGRAMETSAAYLAIGDEALIVAAMAQETGRSEADYSYCAIGNHSFYLYDLGALWHKFTGLPFVFALWIAKKKTVEAKRELFNKFSEDLDRSKRQALMHLPEIAPEFGRILPSDALVEYWQSISYDLTEEHLKGLELFSRYLDELGLIK